MLAIPRSLLQQHCRQFGALEAPTQLFDREEGLRDEIAVALQPHDLGARGEPVAVAQWLGDGDLALRIDPDLPARIEWRCDWCGDEGVISGWEGTYFDLRAPKRRRSTGTVADIVVPDEVAAALRDLQLLDADCGRLVYQARAADDGVVLSADGDELDELLGFVAAEANHEPNRRRQQRLDRAFAVLSDALQAMGS